MDFFKKRDGEQAKSSKSKLEQADDQPKPNESFFIDTKGISSSDLPLYNPTMNTDDTMSMISKSSKMDEMRQQWEQKEQENITRTDIHYQDVLFDEARTHGIGYYAFSVDQTERAKQQQELEVEREKTLEAQRQREKTRLNREKAISDRVFSAKNRQRARNGLSPLNREEYDAVENQKNQVDDEKLKLQAEEEKKKRDEQERLDQEKRKQHLRDWDRGKDNARKATNAESDEGEWAYKPEKPEPMSQEQWNEMKRLERNPEFAPVEPNSSSFNRFTTIGSKTFKRRNASTTENMFNKRIHNELDDVDVSDEKNRRTRAEIPPPPSFDSTARPPRNSNDISASIEAGLQFLREQSDKNATGSKQSWVTKATYEES